MFMLKLGAKPALEKAGDSAFMTGVKESLALFLHYVPGGAGPAAGSKQNVKVVYGLVAAEHRWTELTKPWSSNQDTVAYADVAILQSLSWLSDGAQQAELRKTGSNIVAKRAATSLSGP